MAVDTVGYLPWTEDGLCKLGVEVITPIGLVFGTASQALVTTVFIISGCLVPQSDDPRRLSGPISVTSFWKALEAVISHAA